MAFTLAEAFVELGTKGEKQTNSAIDALKDKLKGLASGKSMLAPVGGVFDSLKGSILGVLSPASMLTSAMGALAGVIGGFSVGGVVSMAALADRTKAEFSVIVGSSAAAAAALKTLKQTFVGTTIGSDQYLAVGREMLSTGTSVQQVSEDLRQLGNISLATGVSLESMGSALHRAETTGKVTIRTLMAMPPLAAELARMYGEDEEAIAALAENGQIGIASLKAAMANLGGEGGKFAGMMDAQKNSLLGQWDILKANVKAVFKDIGDAMIDAFDLKAVTSALAAWAGDFRANYGETIKETFRAIKAVAGAVWDWITEHQTLVKVLASVAGAVVGIGAAGAMIGPIVATLSGLLAGVGTVVGIVTSAVGVLGTVLAAIVSPIGLAVAGAVALGAALVAWLDLPVGRWLSDLGGWLSEVGTAIWNLAANWDLTLGMIKEYTKLAFYNMAERVATWFVNVGELLGWLGSNFWNVLTDIGTFCATVFQNITTNISNAWTALLDFFKTGRFEFDWTDLTEGFKSAVSELPALTRAAVLETTPELDRLKGALASRLEAGSSKGKSGKKDKDPLLEAWLKGGGGSGGAGGVPDLLPGKEKKGPKEKEFSFVNLSALVEKMQAEAGKQNDQKAALAAAQRNADAAEQIAGAAEGGALRVKITNLAGGLQPAVLGA